MKDSKRNTRIRSLVKQLNLRRKKQAMQVDVLCNDIINAHRGFIDSVRNLSFAAEFAESLIGIKDFDHLFYACAQAIRIRIPDMNLAFFHSHEDSFDLYAFECDTIYVAEDQRLEQCFNTDLVKAVTRANQPCDLDQLTGMGLMATPGMLKKISAITLPIAEGGSAAGFILIYGIAGRVTNEHIKMLSMIRRSLCRAISTCQVTAN